MKIKVSKVKHPIISNGFTSGNFFAWDGLWTYHPNVVEYRKKYYLFYTGKRLGRGVKHQIGMAFSSNLKDWEKSPLNPIFKESKNSSDWDSDFVAHCYIYKEGKVYCMFYDGSPEKSWDEAIGLATSTDLITWKRDEKNPIFKVGPNWWEKRHVSRCCIYKEKDNYYMFYAGHDGQRERIGIAKGKNLTTFKRISDDPVLDIGSEKDWDGKSISDPRVIKHKGKYLMFYTGMDEKGNERIGLAISKDLSKWEKYDKNPVLDISQSGWDKISACRADFRIIKGQLHCFYSGRGKMLYNIGVAKILIS